MSDHSEEQAFISNTVSTKSQNRHPFVSDANNTATGNLVPRRASWTSGWVKSTENESYDNTRKSKTSTETLRGSLVKYLPTITTTKSVWKEPTHHAVPRSEEHSGVPIEDLLAAEEDKGGHEVPHREENWHELFYDLIFVAAALQIGHILKKEISLVNIVQTAILFFILRNTWDNLMMYQNRFDTPDLLHYTFYLIQAAAAFIMTLHLTTNHDDTRWDINENMSSFSIAASVSRFTLVLMYLHVLFYTPAFRSGFRNYLQLILIGQFFSGSLFAAVAILNTYRPNPREYSILWILTFFMERTFVNLTHTIMQRMKNKRGRVTLHFEHMVHRQGIFILVISGEAIIQLVQTSANFNATGYLRGCLGFAIVYGVGICYYEQQRMCLAYPTSVKSSEFGYFWEFFHIVLSLTILFFAVGVKEVYLKTNGSEDDTHSGSGDDDGGIGYGRNRTAELLMSINASLSLILVFLLRIIHKGIRSMRIAESQIKRRTRLPTFGIDTRVWSYVTRFVIAVIIAFVPLFTVSSTVTIIVIALFVSALVILDTFAISHHIEELEILASQRRTSVSRRKEGSVDSRSIRRVTYREDVDSGSEGSFSYEPIHIKQPIDRGLYQPLVRNEEST